MKQTANQQSLQSQPQSLQSQPQSLQSQPRGLRNNNPGNIRKSQTRWQGEVIPSKDSAFKQFTTMAYGYRAMMKLLLNYQHLYGLRTVETIITRWAPPIENDTQAYIRHVCREMECTPTQLLDLSREHTLCSLAAAISHHENGVKANPHDLRDGYLLLQDLTPTPGGEKLLMPGKDNPPTSGGEKPLMSGKSSTLPLLVSLLLLAAGALSSCTTVKYIPMEQVHTDSTHTVQNLRDTLYLRDSLFVDRYRQHDTVYVTRTHERTLYRTRWQHDTLYIARRDTIRLPVPVIPDTSPRTPTGLFGILTGPSLPLILLILLILLLRWKASAFSP